MVLLRGGLLSEADYHCIVMTNYSHHYMNIIMICYLTLIYNAINFNSYFLKDMTPIFYFKSNYPI